MYVCKIQIAFKVWIQICKKSIQTCLPGVAVVQDDADILVKLQIQIQNQIQIQIQIQVDLQKHL